MGKCEKSCGDCQHKEKDDMCKKCEDENKQEDQEQFIIFKPDTLDLIYAGFVIFGVVFVAIGFMIIMFLS